MADRYRVWAIRASDNPLTGRARYRVVYAREFLFDNNDEAIRACGFGDVKFTDHKSREITQPFIAFPASRLPKIGTYITPHKEIFSHGTH